ncbi:M81 family metallopeptidase [Glaciimonas sp. CA11.2]|uniref:M81 family metallopeptidase n=1 Tax=Glaciimonas sp. CA11.2 TaxID=3048601 RepID=UPI002AB32CB6|nr:M81 family metallopeptidase [Glaciimonas sp. CA11.2]MDY7545563.1 M81 family metallopeptidase [Glaciimonas sp. CA11.2]MEB0161899.1 M81 family metallopeptidase [Glaciimonas sp. CA11.2]
MLLKIVVARLNHETNTFSPITTPLDAFAPQWDEAAYRDQKGARTAMGAFLDIADGLGATIVTPIAAMANPSAAVAADAYTLMNDAILRAISVGCDAIMLDLHGAMVAENAEDGEGSLLQKIREIAPDTPLCVALDLHGNITQKIIDNADIIVSFKTYPHIDMYEAGEHAGRLLVDMLQQKSHPVVGWCQLPLLSASLTSDTSTSAMQRAVQAAIAAESETGVLAVSIFAGFPLSDFRDAGMSVVVVTENDVVLANQVAEKIARSMWCERDGFVYDSKPLKQSLANAKEMAAGDGAGPVLLLDHSDNVMSGGTCNTLDVLEVAMAEGLTDIGVGPISDPEAVSKLVAAGIGATVTVTLGNKVALTKQGITKTPLTLTGQVLAITDGQFSVTGPIYTGSTIQMGKSVLFDIGVAQIVVTEERVEPYDLGVFTSMGLDPVKKTFLLLKSRMYCRPVFGPISKGLEECDSDTGGPTSSNFALFPIKNVRRPIYPLDMDTRWQ